MALKTPLIWLTKELAKLLIATSPVWAPLMFKKGRTYLSTSFEDWARLLGDVVVITPLLDRLMHHGHLLTFEGKSRRLRQAAERLAKRGPAA